MGTGGGYRLGTVSDVQTSTADISTLRAGTGLQLYAILGVPEHSRRVCWTIIVCCLGNRVIARDVGALKVAVWWVNLEPGPHGAIPRIATVC